MDREMAARGRGASSTRLQVSAASWPGEAAETGPEEAAKKGDKSKNGRSARWW